MYRNQSGQRIWLKAFDASGYVEDGQAAITVLIRIDGAAAVSLGTPTQDTSKKGNYYIEPSQAQTDGHEIKVIAYSSVSGVQVVGTPEVIYTVPATTSLSATAEVTNAVSADGGTITLKRGDDYTGTDLSWSSAVNDQWDLTDKTLVFGFVSGSETLEVNAVIDLPSFCRQAVCVCSVAGVSRD